MLLAACLRGLGCGFLLFFSYNRRVFQVVVVWVPVFRFPVSGVFCVWFRVFMVAPVLFHGLSNLGFDFPLCFFFDANTFFKLLIPPFSCSFFFGESQNPPLLLVSLFSTFSLFSESA